MRRQASEPDLGMAEVLELWGGEFKITIVNMLRVLIEKVKMQKQMGNVSKEKL